MNLLFSNAPSLDLHGMDREITRILVKDFIRDNYNYIHNGYGKLLKQAVHETLKKDKLVEKFYLDFFNIGSTIVSIKRNF